jgi:hypothetical protein
MSLLCFLVLLMRGTYVTRQAVLRTFKARGVWKASALGEASNLPGPAVVDAILGTPLPFQFWFTRGASELTVVGSDAWAFAAADPFRAATHNKVSFHCFNPALSLVANLSLSRRAL